MRKNLFWLNDEQWKRIEPHVPGCSRCRASGRSARHQRNRACVEKRLPLVRLSARIRSSDDDL
jgi:hypothetical protein